MNEVDVIVYYLEMLSKPDSTSAPRQELQVIHAQDPSVGFYRFLYDAVGGPYHWLSRRKMDDQELSDVILDPLDELHVLYHDGSPIGFAELDCHDPDDIELVQFGIIQEFHGRGLGKWFLNWVLDYVWAMRPTRFWLHTCSLDHEAAVPNYLKAGFVEFKQERILREL